MRILYPGMIMAARALLEENPVPTREDIKVALWEISAGARVTKRYIIAVEKAVSEGYCDTFRVRENLAAVSFRPHIGRRRKLLYAGKSG